MKKLLLLFGLVALFLSSCGDDTSAINIEKFCEGDILIPFQEKSGKDWGFINLRGDIVVEPEFDMKPSFAVDGIALIRNFDKNEKLVYRFVRIRDGKVKKSYSRWELAGEFHDGLAPVRKDNEYVKFVNEKFKVVFTAKAEEVAYFNEGRAAFRNKKGKWGFYNKKGKVAIQAKYDFVSSGFCEGYAIVGTIRKGERFFKVIDIYGKTKLNLKDKYEDVLSISEGLIRIRENGMGFIDFEGKKVIKPKRDWDYATDFMNGYSSFLEDDEWGLVDREGEVLFNAKFERPVFVFNESFWYNEDGDWGLKSLDGEKLIEPRFKSDITPYPFMCESSIVGEGRRDFIFIDMEGDEISKMEYDNVAEFDYRYLTNQAWNETFVSDYLDVGALAKKIDKEWFIQKDIKAWCDLLDIDTDELWKDKELDYDYESELDDGYRFYADGSSSFAFKLLQISEDKRTFDYNAYSPEMLRSGRYHEEMLLDDLDYYEPEYYDEYEDEYYDEYEDEEPPMAAYDPYSYLNKSSEHSEAFNAQFPKDAPMGIESLELAATFTDYTGIGEGMDFDTYYDMKYSGMGSIDSILHFNENAKMSSVTATIRLEGSARGKSKLIAKSLKKSWGSWLTEESSGYLGKSGYQAMGYKNGCHLSIRATDNAIIITSRFDMELEYELE